MSWLGTAAHRRPDRIALECGDVVMTYAQLDDRAGRAAAALAERGVRPGDRVGVALTPGVDAVVALHACWLLCAAAVPLDPRLTEAERAARARDVVLTVDAPLSQDSAPLPAAPCGPGDLAMVVHTSGTTRDPKPVEISWANARANAVGSALALGLYPRERWLCPMPLSHVGGLMVLLRSALYATTVVLEPPPFDAARLAGRLNRGDATIVSVVPTMLARLLDAGLERPQRLRCLLLGGGPADPALLHRALAAGVPVSQTYGLTEATSQVTVSDPGEPDTAGWPLAGVDVMIAADGEIVVGGPVVAGGGELATGDLGRLDARGRLQVIGRKADTVVSGGENVAPAEVEAVLLAHPAVADAAVFGRPDEEWGERVVARVLARDEAGLDIAELAAYCRERLAAFKVPKLFEPADGPLPRTASGKLLRRELA